MGDQQLRDAAVVMVGTTHPGNIGACARAMGVMGLDHLLLARPACDPADPAAVARATGSGAILDRAATFPDLGAALATFQRAYAYTARPRDLDHVTMDARAAGRQAAAELAAGMRVALVFGPERAGLTNAEIIRCDAIVEIPTSPGKSSLNVAAAAQLACYELRTAVIAAPVPAPSRELASKAEIDDVLDQIQELVDSNYSSRRPNMRAKLIGRLRLLLSRAAPAPADTKMLRGLLRAFGNALDRRDKP